MRMLKAIDSYDTAIASATSTSSVTESDPTTSLIISGSTSRSVPESTWASSSTASVSTSFTTTLGTDPGMNQVSSLPTPNSGGHNGMTGADQIAFLLATCT